MPLWAIKILTNKNTWIALAVLAVLGAIFVAGYHYSHTLNEQKELKTEVREAREETAAIQETFKKTADALNSNSKVVTKVIHDTQVIKEQIAATPEPTPAPVSPKVLAAIDWVQSYKPSSAPEQPTEEQKVP